MPVNKDNFYKRLEKIERKSSPVEKTVKRSKKQTPKRKGKSRVGGALFAILVLAGGGAGYYFRDNLTPLISDLKQSFARLQALKSSDPVTPKGDQTPLLPGVLREASMYGGLIHSPAVVSAVGQDFQVADIASGFTPLADPVQPKKLILFDKNATCEFRAPKRSEKLYSVNMDYGLIKTKVHAFSERQVIRKITAFLDWNMKFQYTKKRSMEEFLLDGKVNAVDVFVTDTTAPVYLVLQSFNLPTIWNVHAAKGVKISHIALNGRGVSGVVLPNEKTSVEAINYSDFFLSKDEKRKRNSKSADKDEVSCDPQPWRKPKEHWVQWIKANLRSGVYRNQRDTYFEKAREYDKWFRSVFGQGAEDNLTEAEAAAHVLLGPLPKQKIPYHALADSVVHLARADHVFMADNTERKKQVLAVQNEVLDRITNGGFDKVDPGYIEADQ